MDIETKKDKFDQPSKLLAALYSFLFAIPIYSALVAAYYFDFVNGFVFLGALLIMMVIASIVFIIFRENKFKRLLTALVFSLFFLFSVYEFQLINYESHTYIADGYREPEEILEDSGIHILSVGLHDIHYIEDEDLARNIYEKNSVQVFDLHHIKNRDRYGSKTTDIIQFFGFGKDDFQVMGENIRGFTDNNTSIINEFLSRDNLTGDSAGLALGLTAMIHQGNLENTLPIGVTGTLEPNGDVMEIGSLKAKMMIAEQNNFPFIIIPLENLAEAKTLKAEYKLIIEIIPVGHIDEAVEVIKELNETTKTREPR